MSRPPPSPTFDAVEAVLARFPGPPNVERLEMHPRTLSTYIKEMGWAWWSRPRPSEEMRSVLLRPNRRLLRSEVAVALDDGDRVVTDLEPAPSGPGPGSL